MPIKRIVGVELNDTLITTNWSFSVDQFACASEHLYEDTRIPLAKHSRNARLQVFSQFMVRKQIIS